MIFFPSFRGVLRQRNMYDDQIFCRPLTTLCEGGLVFRRERSTGRTAGLAIGAVLALAACSSAPADDPETTAQRFLRALAVNNLDKRAS
jgi:hypothetical protein